MSITAFGSPGSRLHNNFSNLNNFNQTAMAHDTLSDRRSSIANEASYKSTTLLIRKLPRSTTNEAVKTMLLFATDLQDTEIFASEHPDDTGFITAVARFSNAISASEAQAMLNGKAHNTGSANMIVEIVSNSAIGSGMRRNTIDPGTTRGIGQSMSPPPHPTKSSRFNGTFQNMEKLSPPLAGSQSDHGSSESSSHMQNIFSPQSPVGNNLRDRSRISGKSVIDEETGDDETGELLKDPVAYMKGDSSALHNGARSNGSARLPLNGFSALSLNTSMSSALPHSYTSPRSAPMAGPNNAFSPGGHPYQTSGNHYLRHNYPPVNPADQNPPCNTLYVGNLPMDTSEDELKAMFSKQRGYKRLCFRTKQNGPMCFVEFEDVSFATKALNELYGVQLHNSVKSGIRLSFSKNPLGVRSGQPGSGNAATPLSATASGINGFSPMSPNGFSTANGPPPGLSAPPGLNMSNPVSPPLPASHFANQAFSIGTSNLHNPRATHLGNGLGNSSSNGVYPDYMMGR